MNKHYYRIPADSATGRAVRSYHRRCQKAEQAQSEYVSRVGAYACHEQAALFAGGVQKLVFRNPDKVNRNIFRIEGHDPESYEPLFVPNVVTAFHELPLADGQPIPRNSARRIYAQNATTHADGHRTVQYIEVTAAAPDATKGERSRAVTAEIWRLKLPTVPVTDFFRIVHAACPADGHVATTTSPVFYLYHGYYYIGLEYPISHEEAEEINIGQYNMTMREMLSEAKAKK